MNQKTKTAGVLEHSAAALQNADASFSYPDPATVKGRVLADLLAGKTLTHLDAWLAHGTSRLARIAFYSLPARSIANAGDAGLSYAGGGR